MNGLEQASFASGAVPLAVRWRLQASASCRRNERLLNRSGDGPTLQRRQRCGQSCPPCPIRFVYDPESSFPGGALNFQTRMAKPASRSRLRTPNAPIQSTDSLSDRQTADSLHAVLAAMAQENKHCAVGADAEEPDGVTGDPKGIDGRLDNRADLCFPARTKAGQVTVRLGGGPEWVA
jgi:hypothetical protein